jgi:hypothetical protein
MAIEEFLIDAAAFAPMKVFVQGAGVIEIQRGEVVFSERELADRFGVDRQRIRTCVEHLYKTDFLTHDKTHRYTKVFINKYDLYQSMECEDNPAQDPATTQRQPSDNPALIDKKLRSKEEKKERDVAAAPPTPISILGIQKTKTPKLIPDDLAITPQMIDHAAGLGIENVQRVFDAFKAHHANKGTRGLSWGQGWITWCSNETKFRGIGNGGRLTPRQEKLRPTMAIFARREKEIQDELSRIDEEERREKGGDQQDLNSTSQLL